MIALVDVKSFTQGKKEFLVALRKVIYTMYLDCLQVGTNQKS